MGLVETNVGVVGEWQEFSGNRGFYFDIFYNIKYLALMQETTLFFACSFLVGAKTFACSKKITDLRMGQY